MTDTAYNRIGCGEKHDLNQMSHHGVCFVKALIPIEITTLNGEVRKLTVYVSRCIIDTSNILLTIGAGSSGNPCSQTYAGRAPHSEAETRSLTTKVFSIRNRIRMFVSLHSYSQIMLLPYGYSSDIPPEYDDLVRLVLYFSHTPTLFLHTPDMAFTVARFSFCLFYYPFVTYD